MLPLIESRTLTGHSAAVNVVRFNKEGNYLATGSHDKLVKLWNPRSGLCIKTYSGHGWEVLGIDIAPDNTRFVSCGGDRAVFVWDVGTGRVIRRFSGHAARVNDVALNQEATVCVSGSYDAVVKCWDLRSQSERPIQSMADAKDSVTSVAVGESEILTASVDGCLRNYDLRMGLCIEDKVGHPVTCASFSNDNNCVLASSLDDTIRLFDKDNGELLAEYVPKTWKKNHLTLETSYKGHKNHEYKVASTLTNSDAHVISGSEDGKICFWDLVEGKLEKTLHPHTKLVTCVAYHPKDDILVSSSKDGTVKVFTE